MPHQSDDQRMCENGTIDCADESAKLPGTICSSGPEDVSLNPGLQVPRMPSVSQVVDCSSLKSPLRTSTSTWSLAPASGARRQVTRMASAWAQYEPVVASLFNVKRPPLRSTAQMLERVSPEVPTSEVMDASTYWWRTRSRR